nr:SGNH/GDSL hydrolase family protein [Mycobacterium sp. IDR2000157661]
MAVSASSAAPAVFSRYVALGDSFTEGIGDPHAASPNGLRGWADRVAEVLAQRNPEMRYANLAVRGRTMDEIVAEQIQPAAMLEPDLVTIYAGMNDLLAVRKDIDAMMARYADALKSLQQTGALVLTFTAADLGTVPLFRRLRGRAAVYNELLRAIADDLGIRLVDFWRFAEFRDPCLWDSDRVHLSPLGHERMAAKVLDSIAISHRLTSASAALLTSTPPEFDFRANLRWTAAFAAPWVARRLRRVTPGAGVEPKSTTLARVL